jgi:multidrug efflux system membrane fusion protein
MLTGIFSHGETTSDQSKDARLAQALPQVRVQQMTAETVTREVVISGRTEPNRTLALRAEAEGVVQSIGTARGSPIKAGAVLARLDMRDRDSRLKEAESLAAQRELEYVGIGNLIANKFATPVQQAQAKSALDSAKAAVERIKLEIAHINIVSPYDAVLQERSIEVGDFVRIGDKVAELVDIDPIIITGEVNEHEVSKLAVGTKGAAVTVDGMRHEGTVRYLAPKADSNTRSFQVELAVPNPGYKIRAGMTAELRLFADSIRIHKLSAALLSLADDGTIGVKVVDADSKAHFYPVKMEGAAAGGLQQVSGLPDSIRLITVGQAFVTDGQKVDAVEASSIAEKSRQ